MNSKFLAFSASSAARHDATTPVHRRRNAGDLDATRANLDGARADLDATRGDSDTATEVGIEVAARAVAKTRLGQSDNVRESNDEAGVADSIAHSIAHSEGDDR